MLKINNLKKIFNKKSILDNIDITFDKGSIYTILGGNGAGKTTLFECIFGDLSYSDGNITIENGEGTMLALKHGMLPSYLTGHQFIKFLDEENQLLENEKTESEKSKQESSGYEAIEPDNSEYDNTEQHTAERDNAEQDNAEQHPAEQDNTEQHTAEHDNAEQDKTEQDTTDAILDLVNISQEQRHLLIKDYDSETRKRIQLAAFLVKKPYVMMFDELLDYSEDKFFDDFIEVLEKIKKEHIILVSTGILDTATKIPGQIFLLNEGKLAVVDSNELENEAFKRSILELTGEDENE